MYLGEGASATNVAEQVEMETYNNVVFHHLSDFYAPSTLAAILVAACGFGILATDMAYHIPFDLRLVRSPGWLHPLKALNRVAYFIMRIGSLLYLGLLLFFLNTKGNNCRPFFEALFGLWYTAIVCMDFIFIARTVSLWDWRKTIAIPVFALYLTYSSLGAANVAHWGESVQLPGSSFCGYISEPPEAQPLRTRTNIYFGLALTSDICILTLTFIRLAGRSNAGQVRMQQSADGAPKPKLISETLLVQGFVLYGSLLLSKLGFILAYYLSDYRQSWNLMVFGLHITLTTITGGALVRQTSDIIRKTQNHTSVSHSAMSASRSAEFQCTSCHLKKMVDQAEADLRVRRRTEEVQVSEDDKISSSAPSPERTADLELGYSYSPSVRWKGETP